MKQRTFFMISDGRALAHIFCVVTGLMLLVGCAATTTTVQDASPGASDLKFDADAIVRVADRLRQTGDYMSALHMYRRVREQDPGNIAALLGEGEILLGLGAFAQAELRFRAARDAGDNSSRSAAGLGRSLLRQNRPAEALAFFEKALEDPAATREIFNGYGVTLDLLGRHADAQIAYSRGLDRTPGSAILTNNLALSFALSGDFPAAIRILSDLVTARPDAEGARENLALVYGLSGDMAAARNVARLDHQGDELERRLDYIERIASLPPDRRSEAIILGVIPEAAGAAASDVPPATPGPKTGGGTTPDPESSPEPAPGLAPELAEEPTYLVQLGAYLGEGRARAGWAELKSRAPDVLGTLDPTLESAMVDGSEVVRLGILVAGGYAAADALCATLKGAGVDCLVRRAETRSKDVKDKGSAPSDGAL
ncbi:MAG: hypothetical protein D6763_03740 [Alphaproteobacteria bacterium]|nr:MAG: hypothetical protein D6763_03740 [Alphaproteobacteria bacterium]